MRHIASLPYMLWTAVGIHSLVGLGLVMAPVQIARFLVLAGLDVVQSVTHHRPEQGWILGIALLVVSAIAAYGLLREASLKRGVIVACLAPQYLILLGSAVATLFVIVDGNYHGFQFNRFAGLGTVAPILVVATLHTLQILDRYGLRWHANQRNGLLIRSFEAASPQAQAAVIYSLNLEHQWSTGR